MASPEITLFFLFVKVPLQTTGLSGVVKLDPDVVFLSVFQPMIDPGTRIGLTAVVLIYHGESIFSASLTELGL